MSDSAPGLGRLWTPDWNDLRFLASAVLPRTSSVESKYWNDDYWWGNQHETSECVGYSFAHWLEDDPVVHDRLTPPVVAPNYIYTEARLVDEWEGEQYDGTSVRAGAKILQRLGYISEYRWAMTAQEIAVAVLEVGPVVVGTAWTSDMFTPDANGVIRPTGTPAGGHAYLLNGYDTKTGLFRVKNSWGREWGQNGHAFLHISDLEALLAANGEACLALEQRLPVVETEVEVVVPTPVVVPDPIPAPEPQPIPEPIPEPISEPIVPDQPQDVVVIDPSVPADPAPVVEVIPAPEPAPEPATAHCRGWFGRVWSRIYNWALKVFGQ